MSEVARNGVPESIESLIERCKTETGSDKDNEQLQQIFIIAINLHNTYNTFGRESKKAQDVEATLRDLFIEIHNATSSSAKTSDEELDASVQRLGYMLGKMNIGL